MMKKNLLCINQKNISEVYFRFFPLVFYSAILCFSIAIIWVTSIPKSPVDPTFVKVPTANSAAITAAFPPAAPLAPAFTVFFKSIPWFVPIVAGLQICVEGYYIYKEYSRNLPYKWAIFLSLLFLCLWRKLVDQQQHSREYYRDLKRFPSRRRRDFHHFHYGHLWRRGSIYWVDGIYLPRWLHVPIIHKVLGGGERAGSQAFGRFPNCAQRVAHSFCRIVFLVF